MWFETNSDLMYDPFVQNCYTLLEARCIRGCSRKMHASLNEYIRACFCSNAVYAVTSVLKEMNTHI